MAIESVCAGCGNRLSVADANAGKRARCPACGHIYTVPLNPTILEQTDAVHDEFAPLDNRDSTAARDDVDAAGGGRYGAADAFDDAAHGSDEYPGQAPPEAERYWMRAVDGTEYGPVDRQTLQRWFGEGRVGPGYQLRQSRYENWRPADDFRTAWGRTSANPFAGPTHDSNPYQPVASTIPGQQYPQGDQGVFILIMGVLGIFCCPIFGLAAWVMGHQALNAIQAGLANPNSKGLVQVGYYLGIASVVIFILCYCGPLVLSVLD